MIAETANILPSIVCLFFILMYVFKQGKSRSTKTLIALFAVLCTFYFVCATYTRPITNWSYYMISDIVVEGITILLPGTAVLYLRSLDKQLRTRGVATIGVIFILGLVMSVASFLLYGIMGKESAEVYLTGVLQNGGFPDEFRGQRLYEIYRLINFQVYYALVSIELAFVIYYLVSTLIKSHLRFSHIILFFKRDSKLKVVSIQTIICTLIALLGVVRMLHGMGGFIMLTNKSMISISILAVLNAVLCFMLGIIGLWSEEEDISLEMALNPFSSGHIRPAMNEEMEMSEQSYMILKARFDSVMLRDKLFLDPDLSIDALAKRLDSNRTYISKIVNIHYKTDFRNFINMQRINHAKQLIASAPDASMEYIAMKSGFKTLSQFSRKFKEIDGDTPRHWEKHNVRK